MPDSSDPAAPVDAEAYAAAVGRVGASDIPAFALTAFNRMAALSQWQDFDSIASMVELTPEDWFPEPSRATWLLVGAHAVMHSTNPVMSRHRALVDRFSASVVEPFLAQHPRQMPRRRARARRAVGFFGSILHRNTYADRGIRAVLAGLDRRRFEVHALALGSEPLPPADWLGVDVTHVLGDEVAAAHHLRALGLDILIFLDGLQPLIPWQLLARRVAAKQFSWFHSHLTFGAIGMDGQIADPELIPHPQRRWYAEPILDLKGRASCCTVAPQYAATNTPWRQNGWITFGSFNRLSKISVACATAWAEILRRVPTARLLIMNVNAHVEPDRGRVLSRLATAGVPMDRVSLDGGGDEAAFLARYGTVDLVLDTFPFVGGLTSFEGLGQGAPFLTLEGPEMVQRQTASLLRAIGLPQLITTSVEDYIAAAVALAEAPTELERLRHGLRERVAQSPISDMTRLAQDLGDLLAEVPLA
jgi:predicted O-linked N-acetylglucosamine transferase (SPINDLY family)